MELSPRKKSEKEKGCERGGEAKKKTANSEIN